MITIDCCGDICPIPLLKLKKELSNINSSQSVMLITDHSCVVESVNNYLKNLRFSYKIEEVINGVWEITVKKNNN